jgi:Double zinc ribbon
MPILAYFGIESNAFNLVVDLLILFAVVLYCSLIYWTYTDARRRVLDPMMIGLATVVSLFPFVGTLVYLILRPPEYLEDVRERELETQAAEARLHQLDYSLCPHCDYRIERDFIRCPSCLRKLKERCVSCSRPLDRAWTICPYCETEVPDLAPRRRTRRRAAAESDVSPTEGRAARPPRPGRGGVASSAVGDELPAPTTSLSDELPPRAFDELAGAPDDMLSAGGPAESTSRPRGTGRASRPRPAS